MILKPKTVNKHMYLWHVKWCSSRTTVFVPVIWLKQPILKLSSRLLISCYYLLHSVLFNVCRNIEPHVKTSHMNTNEITLENQNELSANWRENWISIEHLQVHSVCWRCSFTSRQVNYKHTDLWLSKKVMDFTGLLCNDPCICMFFRTKTVQSHF